MVMLTIRNIGGVSLLLAGSTWIWLTPAFAGRGVSTSGATWAVTRFLCLLVVAGFCVATYGLFNRHAWWEAVALGSTVVGLLALVPYWIAAHSGGETVGTATWNAFTHVLMAAGIFALLLLPSLEHWVDHHVMSG
jgi:hypothetical protein